MPDGFTGEEGRFVDERQLNAWLRKVKPERPRAGNLIFTPGNIALRMPKDVIGIDIDLHSGKMGRQTLEACEEKWGELPPTWVSTSRYDGSGIHFFRVPEGLRWRDPGPGIETLKWYHRYAMVMPSIHDKTGKPYYWIRPDGVRVTDEIPSVEELPALPPEWVAGLTGGEKWSPGPGGGDIPYAEAREWITENGAGAPCEQILKTLTEYTRLVRQAGDDGGAHDRARDGAWAILGDAALGHTGAKQALRKLQKVFLTAVKGRRDGTAEWRRICVRGVGKVKTELGGAEIGEDPCALFASSIGGAPTGDSSTGDSSTGRKSGSTVYDYARDDVGNAQRLARAVGTDALWVEGQDSWAVYDPESSLWDLEGGDSAIMRAAIKMVRGMEAEAKFIEDPKEQSSFLSWVRSSGNVGKLRAMIELLKDMKGYRAQAERFDMQPTLLQCANGTLDLATGEFRLRRHADYATFCTPVPFDSKASSDEWEGFLKTVLPDPADRAWVRTLAGYCLLGGNPERVMVFAKGPTTSGKTTFADAIMTALGKYAATFNLSLFRDKQDEAPRSDIVAALPKRLLVASEASSQWFLHADAIKRFTGGEPIRARKLNSNVWIEATPQFTPWLMTNSYPQVPGADKALWRRLKAAPFLVSLPESKVDPKMRERLRRPDVSTAVFAWLVRGWENYQEDALDDDSPNSMEMLFEARNSMSDVDVFLSEACEFAAEYKEEARRLYDAYRSWCEANGLGAAQILSLTAFGRNLSGKGYEPAREYVGEEGERRQVRVRTGLRLNDSYAKFGV